MCMYVCMCVCVCVCVCDERCRADLFDLTWLLHFHFLLPIFFLIALRDSLFILSSQVSCISHHIHLLNSFSTFLLLVYTHTLTHSLTHTTHNTQVDRHSSSSHIHQVNSFHLFLLFFYRCSFWTRQRATQSNAG